MITVQSPVASTPRLGATVPQNAGSESIACGFVTTESLLCRLPGDA